MGPLRRFFGYFLSLVKESNPSETGHGGCIVGIIVSVGVKSNSFPPLPS